MATIESNKQKPVLLVIALVWPEPNSTAAGVRMLQLLDFFLKSGYDITVASSAATTEFSEELVAMGIKTQTIELNKSSFDGFVKVLSPSIVVFDRFLTEEQFGWRIAEQVPDALRILDTEDLHSLRHVRELCFKNGMEFTTGLWLQDEKTKREIASIYRCDLSLIISSFEIELLTGVLKIDKNQLLLLPFMVGEITETEIGPMYGERSDFIFIGGGKHAPNLNAITYLKTEIWPLVRQHLPEAKLNICGSYFPEQVLKMHNTEQGFLVQGRVEDAKAVMQQARVCLAPLRFGAGIKGKLLDAMRYGTPSITTDIGAEGMHGILEWNGFIQNEPQEFANSAVRLYTEKKIWKKAQEQGKTLINTLYSEKNLTKIFTEKLDFLQTNLQQRRQQNFIGQLLLHQTLASTKYMSKWIEEKNKYSNKNR